MHYQIKIGDCVAAMQAMPDNSVDSIVTDPPYELGFMGKAWDASGIANNVEMWREALRVLKPGGHLLAFSGSRTYHRMTCAIEDAGFEVRDQIMWVYSSGFPKSHNMDNHKGKLTCGCTTDAVPYTHENTEPKTERDMRSVLHADVSPSESANQERGQVLQPRVPKQSAPATGRPEFPVAEDRRGQPRVEGWGDDVQTEGQLQGHPVHSGAGSIATDGAGGRLHHGASGRDGAVVRVPADSGGSGASRRPRSNKQPSQQPGTVADEQRAQAARAWPDCAWCGLPVVPQGLGTALKPAHEPICVARKPLIGTVAANVLAHGTGALNIDGCRVETADNLNGGAYAASSSKDAADASSFAMGASAGVFVQPEGRWPANLIHDGSAEVLAAFPDAKGQQGTTAERQQQGALYGAVSAGEPGIEPRNDAGSAARFFYCAKASKSDRGDGNTHPTVKPTDVMAYLVRLVTPPGGLVLDPFMGSGSTGKAAMREGFRFIGCELSAEYAAIAEARISHEFAKDLI
jgi:hypothetical protein